MNSNIYNEINTIYNNGIDINEDYISLSERRVESIIPYTDENPNPKKEFLHSKEELLCKRKNSKKD